MKVEYNREGVPPVLETTPTRAQSIGLLLGRIPLGVYFFLAGLAKLGDVNGFVNTALPMATKYMPEQWGRTYLTGLPFVEMAVGVLIVLGLLTRVIAFVGAALLVSFTIAATGPLDPPKPFHLNLILLGIMLLYVFTGPGRFSLDRFLWRPRKVVTVTE